MFQIYCPHCQEFREEEEFQASGEAHIARPADPDNCSDREWGEFLYFRSNIKGLHRELWVHSAGCRKYFNIARDSQTYKVHGSYKIGEMLDVPASASSTATVSSIAPGTGKRG